MTTAMAPRTATMCRAHAIVVSCRGRLRDEVTEVLDREGVDVVTVDTADPSTISTADVNCRRTGSPHGTQPAQSFVVLLTDHRRSPPRRGLRGWRARLANHAEDVFAAQVVAQSPATVARLLVVGDIRDGAAPKEARRRIVGAAQRIAYEAEIAGTQVISVRYLVVEADRPHALAAALATWFRNRPRPVDPREGHRRIVP